MIGTVYDIRMPRIVRSDSIVPNDELRAHFAIRTQLPDDLICVTTRSPVTHRRAVYACACYFRREGGYDFVQYGHDGQEDDEDARAYLWSTLCLDERGGDVALGACCFRLRCIPPMMINRYDLQWIWLHPYVRRHGYLTRAWPYFSARFPSFVPEPPLSPAMIAFLATQASSSAAPSSAG